MSWLTLAIGAIKFLNWAAGYLDAQSKEQVIRELVQSENLKNDIASVTRADAARAGVPTDPGSVRDLDQNSRT